MINSWDVFKTQLIQHHILVGNYMVNILCKLVVMVTVLYLILSDLTNNGLIIFFIIGLTFILLYWITIDILMIIKGNNTLKDYRRN